MNVTGRLVSLAAEDASGSTITSTLPPKPPPTVPPTKCSLCADIQNERELSRVKNIACVFGIAGEPFIASADSTAGRFSRGMFDRGRSS